MNTEILARRMYKYWLTKPGNADRVSFDELENLEKREVIAFAEFLEFYRKDTIARLKKYFNDASERMDHKENCLVLRRLDLLK